MRDCWNWRLLAALLLYCCLYVVRGSDSDVDTERASAESQISDLNQQTIVPDSHIATTSFENTGHTTEVSALTKQKRCNRDRLGATLTPRQNLPSDINLIPKTLDASQIAKNLCIQCISLNKCKTSEGCKACSLLCKDVVLLKDQTKAPDAPNVECANPTTTQGDEGPVVEDVASGEGAGETTDVEQHPTASDGPVLGSRAGFGEESACEGHLLATVTTVRATTRSGAAPVAKGPEGPEALLTIFKDELTSAILAENVATGMQEPPTMHELFFKVLEMVQNSKPEVSHVGATHTESPSQTQDDKLTQNPQSEARQSSSESEMITGSQNQRLRTNQVDSPHTEKSSPAQVSNSEELGVHPLFREDESFILKSSENPKQSSRSSSEVAEKLSKEQVLEANEEELKKHLLTASTQGANSSDTARFFSREMQEDEEREAVLPQVEERSQQSDRLGSVHEQISSRREMEEEDGDTLPRFPLTDKEGFVVPQVANPAIIEGPPLPGMVLGATQKENQSSEVMHEMQNPSPNDRQAEAIDAIEEDLPRYNLADHEGSLVLQVSNISTIGIPPKGNGVDDSSIPDMDAEASEQRVVSETDRSRPIEAMTRSEAEEEGLTGSADTLGDSIKMEAKIPPKEAFNSVEEADAPKDILGVVAGTELKDSNSNSLGETSLNKITDSTVHKLQKEGSESMDKLGELSKSTIKEAEDGHSMVVNMKAENPRTESFDTESILLGTPTRLGSTESAVVETARAPSVNKIDDFKPNQETLSNDTLVKDGSTIEVSEQNSQAADRLERISELKSNILKDDSPGLSTKETEFGEMLPQDTIEGSADNSIIPSRENKALEGKPISMNMEEDIPDATNHKTAQRIPLYADKENASGFEIMTDGEASASEHEPLGSTKEIITPEPTPAIHLKSSADETIASAAYGNDWNKLVEPFNHTDEIQSKLLLSSTRVNSPTAENRGTDIIDSNMNIDHLKTDQSSSRESIKEDVLETATDKELAAAQKPFLGSTANAGDVFSQPTVAPGLGNVMEAKNIGKDDVDTASGLSSPKTVLDTSSESRVVFIKETGPFVQNATMDSILQDLRADVPAMDSQTASLDEVSVSTLDEISEQKAEPGAMAKASADIAMPGDDVVDLSETMSFDTAAGTSHTVSATATFVGTPPENRNEISTADKPAVLSTNTAGAKFENKAGILDAKPTHIEDTFGGPPLAIPESPTNGQLITGGKADTSLALNSTILRTEDNTMDKKADRLSGSSSTGSVVADELEDRNDMVAESSENRVMNVVVPDEFLGWSKPSDNPTTINIVIPPKPVPMNNLKLYGNARSIDDNSTNENLLKKQESANIEKADLREEEPEDEPRDHGEHAEPETLDGEEEVSNREAEADEDFEEENQVRVSDDEQDRITGITNRNREFDENPEMETQLRESDNEAPFMATYELGINLFKSRRTQACTSLRNIFQQDDEEQTADDDSPNNIDEDENEEEALEEREADNSNDEEGQTLKENEKSDIGTDRKTGIGIKQPQSFSRLKKLMHSMPSPQERLASIMKKAKDRSNLGAEAPPLPEEGDSTFPKKLKKTESKIGKMLERFRDRLNKNKADGDASTVSSPAREKFAKQDASAIKNPDNSDTFGEANTDSEDDEGLSKQHDHDDGDSELDKDIKPDIPEKSQDLASRAPDTLNQEVVHTTYKSPDFKLPSRNSEHLGNGRLASDSQLKVLEDLTLVDPPRRTQPQGRPQWIFNDSQDPSKTQTNSQLKERINVVDDPSLHFTPGEDPTLQEPDRELALSGISQNNLVPTTEGTIFGDHFPSTPSLSEIISSAKDKFRKTFEESTRTLNSTSRPVVGSAKQEDIFHSTPKVQLTPGLDRILGDSSINSGISSDNIQSPDEMSTFHKGFTGGEVVRDTNVDNGESLTNGFQNPGLASLDGASLGHTIQEIGQNTGRVIQETTNILGDTIRSGKQGMENIFRGVNDLASRSNGQQIFGESLGNPDPARTFRYKLPTSGITDTLAQSLNKGSVGDLDGDRKVISDGSPTKLVLDNIGAPRVNFNRFGQVNLDTANQEDVTGIGLTPHVTVQPPETIGKLNLNKFDNSGLLSPSTLQPFNNIEEAHLRQPSEGNTGFTGLTLPVTVNRIEPLGNLKPITVSGIDVKDPTNVDNLHPLGSPQSELIVEPPGLDTSDSSEEGLKEGTDLSKQNQPLIFLYLPGRLRKKDGIGKKASATSEEQPSVSDVVKVLQEVSKEVISTAENVSKSKVKDVQPTEPNIVGSQFLENSWENLQPFLPRDSHPLTITRPSFPHHQHVVAMVPTTTLKTPLHTSVAPPLFQKLLDRTSTYYSASSEPKQGNNVQMPMEPIKNQVGNTGPSSNLLPSLTDKKIKEQPQTHNPEQTPVRSSVAASNGLVPLPSSSANDDTNRIGMVKSNQQVKKPIPFGLDRELPQSINDMLTPKSEEEASPVKASTSMGSEATETAKLPSVVGEPVQLPPIPGDLSSSSLASSSSDRVESRQPATENIEERMNNRAETESSPVLTARQNGVAISAETPRDIYFVGTGMKLPLQMVKKEGGEVHLSVDIDKLCSCKNNSSCAKNQSANGLKLKQNLTADGSSSDSLAVDDPVLGKTAGDGFAKRNIPTHRSLRDVEDRYTVEWEIGEPEEVNSDSRHSTVTEGTKGEHRIEIEIDDPIILPRSSSFHAQETSNVKLVNRISVKTDESKLKDTKTMVGSPNKTTPGIASKNKPDINSNTIQKISDKIISNQPGDTEMERPKGTQGKVNDTANIYKTGDMAMKKSNAYDNIDKANTDQTNLTQLNVKKAESYQHSSPFRRLHYPALSSKSSLGRTESVATSTEKSTYLSNLLKKLRSRLPTQEPRTVNTNLRSASNLFSHRTRNQEVESDEGPKPTKLSNRFKDLNVDRYSNLALRNRLFPTLGRQKEALAKLEKTADEKEVLPLEDEDKEKPGTGIMKNVLTWFKNLNNKQKR
nr:unnamed protein product [Callosobruchus analis]